MTPSRTAQRVAERRAAHQLVDDPIVLRDPLALRIVGAMRHDERARLAAREQGRLARTLRAFLAARSRMAEEEVSRLAERGPCQYVVLGAGLDTFAYRHRFEHVTVFEVDQPSTQAWKRERLTEASIDFDGRVTFVEADLEAGSLVTRLEAAGWNPRVATVVAWLGVTMYLERSTVLAILAALGRAEGSRTLIFDYALAPSLLGPVERLVYDEFAKRVAAAGEPWLTSFEPDDLCRELGLAGFDRVEDYGPTELNSRYFADRADGMRVGALAHIVSASR